jgi:hypothetical protein
MEMDVLIKIINFVTANSDVMLGSVIGILSGVIGICLLIPGPQPEKALQAVVDFLSKFSRKPPQS